jgi:hypothetical protein
MEDGEDEVATYFKVTKQWDELLDQWNEEGKVVISFKRYYKLLFLVKSASEVDHIWFSFFEGMHCHAAIVAGLVCSVFNHLTNKLEPGSLTLEILSLSRNRTIQFLTIWTSHVKKNLTRQCFRTNFIYQHTFQNRL